MGICPPSNAAEMFFRALVPLVPRPAVLPFEPSPRPTRVLGVFDPGTGRRWCTLSTPGRAGTSAFLAGAFLAEASALVAAFLAGAFLAEALSAAFFAEALTS